MIKLLASLFMFVLVWLSLRPLMQSQVPVAWQKRLSPVWVIGQIFFVSLTISMVLFESSMQDFKLIIAIGWPVIGPFMLIHAFERHADFLTWPVAVAASLSAIAAVASASGIAPPILRQIWPTTAVSIFFAVFVLAGSYSYDANIRGAAQNLTPDCIVAGSFLNSLAIFGTDFQFNLHAYAEKSNVRYAWSYGERGFYRLPDSVRNSSVPSGAKLSLPFPRCPG